MADQQRSRTFQAADHAPRQAWPAVIVALAAIAVGLYVLQPLVAGLVAVLTALVAVPLALLHRRAEASSEVDVSDTVVELRRGGEVQARVDRRSSAFEVIAFADRHGIVPQLLITDGEEHIRLVTGQWRASTLVNLAQAASGARPPRQATWKEVSSGQRSALAFWERHTTAIIAGTLVGIPVLVVLGAVLAVLLFDVG